MSEHLLDRSLPFLKMSLCSAAGLYSFIIPACYNAPTEFLTRFAISVYMEIIWSCNMIFCQIKLSSKNSCSIPETPEYLESEDA